MGLFSYSKYKKMIRILNNKRLLFGINLTIFIQPQDMFIGFLYDEDNAIVYVCPIPGLVFQFDKKWSGEDLIDYFQKNPVDIDLNAIEEDGTKN